MPWSIDDQVARGVSAHHFLEVEHGESGALNRAGPATPEEVPFSPDPAQPYRMSSPSRPSVEAREKPIQLQPMMLARDGRRFPGLPRRTDRTR